MLVLLGSTSNEAADRGRASLPAVVAAGDQHTEHHSCLSRACQPALQPALSGERVMLASRTRSEAEAQFRPVRLAAHSARPIV